MTGDASKTMRTAQIEVEPFLRTAREKCSFASGAERKNLPDGRIQIGPFYMPGSPLSYLDVWVNEKRGFSGEEKVNCGDRTVWHSKYAAGILDPQYLEGEPHKALSAVLRTAQKSSPSLYQRGPECLEVGDYTYLSMCLGDMHHFIGIERILHKKKLVLGLVYRGGDSE